MNSHPLPNVDALVVTLPNELIVEVLSFLEVKYLMRIKCVCKSLKTLIFDPVFVKIYLKKQSTGMTHLAFLSCISEESKDCRSVPISRLLETFLNSITLTDPNYRFNYKDCCEYHEHSFMQFSVAEYHKHSFCTPMQQGQHLKH